MDNLRLGTRGSLLATTQSKLVAEKVSQIYSTANKNELETNIVIIKTLGDVDQTSPFEKFNKFGIFVNNLRNSLLDNQCDYIVHSLKDLPADNPPKGIKLVAIVNRGDARDVLCSRNNLKLDTLPDGSTIGTASARRKAQLTKKYPKLNIVNLRGNIDSRLKKIDSELDAILLAKAGLERIKRTEKISEILELENWPTAAGQGALAVECRESDLELIKLLEQLNDKKTEFFTFLERGVLKWLNANCSTAIGVSTFTKKNENFLKVEYFKNADNYINKLTKIPKNLFEKGPKDWDSFAKSIVENLSNG